MPDASAIPSKSFHFTRIQRHFLIQPSPDEGGLDRLADPRLFLLKKARLRPLVLRAAGGGPRLLCVSHACSLEAPPRCPYMLRRADHR